MKTLTELSGSLIRMAAKAVAEAKRSLPKEEPPPSEPASAEAVVVPQEAAPATDAAPEAQVEAAEPTAEAAEAAAAPAPAAPKKPDEPKAEVESEAVKSALDTAVAQATGLSGDRLARLRDALKIVGRRSDNVRLVRVFGPEEQIKGAVTLGDFQYLVDLAPASMKQIMAPPGKDRGGKRGGGGRGGGGGGDRGRSGGTKAGATGGFSMDSLREDRKGSGRGRPGAGRKPGGGRPGGAPGGK